MDIWRGDHDFPPEIETLVANYMPPYYIVADSRCIVPFSATNSHARDHADQVASRAKGGGFDDQCSLHAAAQSGIPVQTFSEPPVGSLMEVLASRLARFTRQMIAQGITSTDEMLQQESRRLVYGCDDSWNQTIFDNLEWLASFRRQHIGQDPPSDAFQLPTDLDGLSLANLRLRNN
ncbi:uncharacterized protein KD926_005962 [Aspergillus affinis]|uniref:uncharacterized protein n=1 Tax=Aspergillus affinis TaxID=1070780 RepID=UPI0022FDF1D2|nr:uncharacterized protein KD926_005962 [Aspergillus affinis]KAI9046016.1 hypothetical protein KD926_005962 [Aspergillus affinis]